MNDIDQRDIRKLDGRLLLVFHELFLLRQATAVATKLGLSQSAISNSLTQLRELFGDPLFVRHTRGLEPTARAFDLAPRIQALLAATMDVLGTSDDFDPLTSSRTFTIAAPHFVTTLIGPDLLDLVEQQAPNVTIANLNLFLDEALHAVQVGDADVAIGLFVDLPAGLTSELLYEDSYKVVARKDHPQLKGRVTAAQYRKLGHIFVGLPPRFLARHLLYDQDQMAATYGLIPEQEEILTRAYVSQWETALWMASTSNSLADCPGRLAEKFAERLGLQILQPPYKTERQSYHLVRRAEYSDPGTHWLAERIVEVLG